MQNVSLAHLAPETRVEAAIADWDCEHCDAEGDCLAPAIGLDGLPALAGVCVARLKPRRRLLAGIQDAWIALGWRNSRRRAKRASPWA